MIKVMVFGTFEGVHPGHKNFFEQAKKHGDYLIAVVGRDKTVEKLKGQRPEFSEVERKNLVSQVPGVDLTVLGKYRNKFEIIADHRPDVICLGYDQNSFVENIEYEVKKMGLATKIVRLKSYHPEIYKSSLLKKHKK
ncbi:MAG: adenylyltransferase/cytidyltransferase family protein [Patescibacteria group bacterium]|nr:adenylyltransferase/cytidyltransferase family protein [Patescibacteria group bacterium]